MVVKPKLLAQALLGVAQAAFWVLLLSYALLPWFARGQKMDTIVFYGFSILGESMNKQIFPEFSHQWREKTGERLEFISSFSGSGTVTNQLLMGVPAELAVLSLELDAERLSSAHLVAPFGWRALPHQGVLNRTPFIILVRAGNPKGIHDFADLARPGIGVVHPDPLTSGGANWAILAEYGAAARHSDNPRQAGHDLLLGIWRNVVAQAASARAARTQFENGFGDALITYEQEAVADLAQGKLHGEVIYPRSTVLSEHTVVVINDNLTPATRPAVEALVAFLWSDTAQRLFVKSGFRSVTESLNADNLYFKKIEDPFLVSDFGGWDRVKVDIIDGVWKTQVLKELGKQ